MKSEEIRQRFLNFFQQRGHAILPSASLVPENDPTVLFNTAGMQPLVPYLMGAKHPNGLRLANVQKCVRTQDIDEVGDATHDTFFEMLGNWSLGDYFKQESITWSYELLTNSDVGLGLDPGRLYVTVFAGDENAPRDEESYAIWQSLGIPDDRIYFLDAKSNWWSPGNSGPCGPDTEIFYDITDHGLGRMTLDEFQQADQKQEIIEIWNNVFMEYEKLDGRVIGKLKQRNVDTGAGLERWAMVLQQKKNVFETDLFMPLMSVIKGYGSNLSVRDQRIIADHLRTAIFLIGDGVRCSNTDQGYILRRLLRRAILKLHTMDLNEDFISQVVDVVLEKYGSTYTNLLTSRTDIISEIWQETNKFNQTLNLGMKEFSKLNTLEISAEQAFKLATTYGFPLDLITDLAQTNNQVVDTTGFQVLFKQHQDKSRSGATQRFKGGLADTSDMSIKYHTATHLLHQALVDVLGSEVTQKGSNITPDRLRFDFSYSGKMTDLQKQQVEDIVNQKIIANLPVRKIELPREEAMKTEAKRFFADKYGEMVNIYYIGDSLDKAYSKEFCGGPHVNETGQLGKFKILKEEAVAAGIRRIKATLS